MYNVELITGLDDMVALRDEWNGLWRKSVIRSPYQRWEWNYHWVVGSQQEKYLYILIARNANGTLVGIAPFKNKPVFGMFGTLSFISNEASCYTDFLFEEGNDAKVVLAFMLYLSDNSNVQHFNVKIAEPSPSIAALKRIFDENDWYKVDFDDYTKRLMICVGNDYDKYLSGLSRKMRQEVRSATKKLTKNFNVDFSVTDVKSIFDDEMAVLFGLNTLRWGGDVEKSHLVHRDCYRAFHETRDAKIFLLSCDGKPVAGISALIVDDTIFLEVAGFDYSFFKIDLGKVFYDYLFRWCVEHGFNQIDFSSGEEPYKFRYHPDEFTKWKINAYRNKYMYLLVKINRFYLTKSHNLKAVILHMRDFFIEKEK